MQIELSTYQSIALDNCLSSLHLLLNEKIPYESRMELLQTIVSDPDVQSVFQSNRIALESRRDDLLKTAAQVWGGKIPKRVCMLKTVRSDSSFLSGSNLVCHEEETYEVEVNPHGAVSAILGDRRLGLKPAEFSVVEWCR